MIPDADAHERQLRGIEHRHDIDVDALGEIEHSPTDPLDDAADALEQLPTVAHATVVGDHLEATVIGERVPPSVMDRLATRDLAIDPSRTATRLGPPRTVVVAKPTDK